MAVPPSATSKIIDEKDFQIVLTGTFQVEHWHDLQTLYKNILSAIPATTSQVILDASAVKGWDTFGAWILSSLENELRHQKKNLVWEKVSPDLADMVKEIKHTKSPPPHKTISLLTPRDVVAQIGEETDQAGQGLKKALSFLGEVVQGILSYIQKPQLFRLKSFLQIIEITGIRALPIIGLVSVLIGIVLVYQGVSQLERFGAQIYTVNLLAISILRELGILMTAIVVAGRSGSAFTAQIGFMKLNQELDALKVLGLSPLHLLIIPRVLGLMVVMPLLTVYCDLVALVGGGFMSMHLIDLSLSQYLTQLQSSISNTAFWVGIIKAPVFAFVIALTGCYEGLQVSGGADSVGKHTTQSVVKSIFMVIVLNAMFSILFAELEI